MNVIQMQDILQLADLVKSFLRVHGYEDRMVTGFVKCEGR